MTSPGRFHPMTKRFASSLLSLALLAVASPAFLMADTNTGSTIVHFKNGHTLQVAAATLMKDGIWNVTLLSGGEIRLPASVVEKVDAKSTLQGQEPGNRITAQAVPRGAFDAGSPSGAPAGAGGNDPMADAVTDEEKVEASRDARGVKKPPALVETPAQHPQGLLAPGGDGIQTAPPRGAAGPNAAGNGSLRKGQIKGGIWSVKKGAVEPPSIRK